MAEMTPFRYVEFYDVPRLILVNYRDRHFLLSSWFEEKTDDYRDQYAVYALSEPDLIAFREMGWKFVENHALTHLGDLPVSAVRFDSTRRRKLDASILREFTRVSIEESPRPKSE